MKVNVNENSSYGGKEKGVPEEETRAKIRGPWIYFMILRMPRIKYSKQIQT